MSKILQRGEDNQFDQLIVAFGTVAEHCLPSLLKTLFAWYERQLGQFEPDLTAPESKKNEPKGKRLVSLSLLVIITLPRNNFYFREQRKYRM